jgi:centrosomal CEP192-like protein
MSAGTSLSFGNVTVSTTSDKTVTVSNKGRSHPLIISSAITTDPEYVLNGKGTCGTIPVTLAPRKSCSIGVAFTPASLGLHSGTLALSDNSMTSPQQVSLSGTGIGGLSTSSTSAVFGSVKFGSSASNNITVTNNQSQPVTLSESISGTNAADFSITGSTCPIAPATLAAKTSCKVTMTFKPSALGTESATLSVSDSPDSLGPYDVALTTGATIPVSVSPTSLLYGTVSRTSSKTMTASVTNMSPLTLSLDSAISGLNAGDFTITGGTCGSTLAGNSSCTVAVTFKPTKTVRESATLAGMVTSDPSSPHNVSLKGRGS